MLILGGDNTVSTMELKGIDPLVSLPRSIHGWVLPILARSLSHSFLKFSTIVDDINIWGHSEVSLISGAK